MTDFTTVKKNLESKRFRVSMFATAEEAADYLDRSIDGVSVGIGGSVTAEQMGLQPEECLVIEDSTVGITAGHCAGMTVAALIDNRFSFDRSLADYELNSLEEIVPLAEKIRDLK